VGSGEFISYMKVRNIIEDYALPETDQLLSYKIVIGLNYLEETVKAV